MKNTTQDIDEFLKGVRVTSEITTGEAKTTYTWFYKDGKRYHMISSSWGGRMVFNIDSFPVKTKDFILGLKKELYDNRG